MGDQVKAIKQNIAKAKLSLGEQSIAVDRNIGQYHTRSSAKLGSYVTDNLGQKFHTEMVNTKNMVVKKRREIDELLDNKLQGIIDAAQAATQGRQQTEDSAVASQQRIKGLMENAEAQAATEISAASAKANVKVSGAVAASGNNFGG